MNTSRIPSQRGPTVEFEFDGEPILAYEGETVAAALLAAHVEAFGITRDGDPRLPVCNMGTCFDCAVTVDGEPMVRSCLRDVSAGICVTRNEAS